MPVTAVPLGDLKLYLSIEVDTHDDVLTSFLQATIENIEELTGRRIEGVGTVSYLENGNGSNKLWLHDDPVSFTSITERDQAGLATFTTIDAADYYLQGRKLVRLTNTSGVGAGNLWARGFNNFQVTYQAGFTPTTLPSRLALAIKAICGVFWEKRNATGVKREKIGKYEIEYASAAKFAEAGGVPVDQIIAQYMTDVSTRGVA